MSKLDDIKYGAMVSHQGVHPQVSLSKMEFDWLIKQAEMVNKIKGFCESESEVYSEMKMDDERHKVNRVFFNGKQKAFENVLAHIHNLEES